MALGDNVINVNINPNGEPDNTSAKDTTPTTSGESLKDRNDTSANVVDLALLGGSALNLAQATAGQAEAITGDALVQKNVNFVGGLIGIVGVGLKSPGLALAFATTSAIKKVATQLLVARNANIESDYNSSVRGNAYNNGRIVGGIQ